MINDYHDIIANTSFTYINILNCDIYLVVDFLYVGTIEWTTKTVQVHLFQKVLGLSKFMESLWQGGLLVMV